MSDPAGVLRVRMAAYLTGATDELDRSEMLATPPDWHQSASCRSVPSSVFFPLKGQRHDEARRVCSTCLVVGSCLSWALRQDDLDGVWAGTTPTDRERPRRERPRRERPAALA